ncbi:helix-turn-helix domain-containing protein [Thalassomonas sp. M1454]|uniref:helix-turn-helix domain-containing protein n=1 Tax=Thalassomonas sp. M1454 TaxID=2594477 RepID=UPI001180994B|nr:helix-turn-helix domain-containing protein [Thalassomonas sp. M1454]TRX55720.1 AraC family transcriptional regulator [Thalassomonas sp. M1454]
MMDQISHFFAQFAFAQMVIAILLLLPLLANSQQVRLYCSLVVCASLYLLPNIFGSFTLDNLFAWLIFIAGNLLPGVFYLVCVSLFREQVKLKSWQFSLATTPAIILLVAQMVQINLNLESDSAILYPSKVFVLILDLGLACYALFVAIKSWRNDLVADRRIVRGGVISIAATYIILVILLGQVVQVNWSWLNPLEMALLALLMTGLNFYMFRVKPDSLFAKPVNTEVNEALPVEDAALQSLKQTMLDESLYKQEGLTISQLSKSIGIAEHKLRVLINTELGYRNFNDFLNYYRIQYVSEKLLTNEHKTTPILSLAMEAGFRSLSSFNRAFKMTHNATPSEYRKNQSA